MPNSKLRSIELTPQNSGVYQINLIGTIYSLLAKSGAYTKQLFKYAQVGNQLTILEPLDAGVNSIIVNLYSDVVTTPSIVLGINEGVVKLGESVKLSAIVADAGSTTDIVKIYVANRTAGSLTDELSVTKVDFDYEATFTPTVAGEYTVFARLTNLDRAESVSSRLGRVLVLPQNATAAQKATEQLTAKGYTNLWKVAPQVSGDVAFNSDGTIELFDNATRRSTITFNADPSIPGQIGNYELSWRIIDAQAQTTSTLSVPGIGLPAFAVGLQTVYYYVPAANNVPGTFSITVNFTAPGYPDINNISSVKMSLPQLRRVHDDALGMPLTRLEAAIVPFNVVMGTEFIVNHVDAVLTTGVSTDITLTGVGLDKVFGIYNTSDSVTGEFPFTNKVVSADGKTITFTADRGYGQTFYLKDSKGIMHVATYLGPNL